MVPSVRGSFSKRAFLGQNRGYRNTSSVEMETVFRSLESLIKIALLVIDEE